MLVSNSFAPGGHHLVAKAFEILPSASLDVPNFNDNHFLNRQYTVYGRVIDGMDLVDEIVRGEPPANPDRMVSVKVAADV